MVAKSRGGQASGRIAKNITVKLFEFDPRFEVFGDDFVLYDFQQPLRGLPPQLKGAFDRVLIDPPFLSEDCQTKSIPSVSPALRFSSSPSSVSPALRVSAPPAPPSSFFFSSGGVG